MNRSVSIIGAGVLGIALIGAGACGSGAEADESSELTFAFHGRPGHPHVSGTGAAGAAGAASAGGVPSAPPAPNDVQAVISAAQNPDGTAIPQGPGPHGECPDVLVLLGFWSCPQIGQTCSYTSGATHHCQCDRINGEGGLPAWVCDE